MDLQAAAALLARSSSPLMRSLRITHEAITAIRTDDCTARRRLDHLYELSNSMSKESRQHWDNHFRQNNVLQTIQISHDRNRDGDNERDDHSSSDVSVLGFQLWRWKMMESRSDSDVRGQKTCVLIGGKLRFATDIRGHGLNILTNLIAAAHPPPEIASVPPKLRRVFRLGLFNVHGLSSVVPSLQKYEVSPFDEHGSEMYQHVKPFLDEFIAENGFQFSRDYSGRVDVGQSSVKAPDDFGERWWNRPGVSLFRQAQQIGTMNPVQLSRHETLSRRNDMFLMWELDNDNIDAMIRYMKKKIV